MERELAVTSDTRNASNGPFKKKKKDKDLRGKDQGHVPNWSALLSPVESGLTCVYIQVQELDVERSLCVGGRDYKEGRTGGRGKTDGHCMLSFVWNPIYHVYMWRRKGREDSGVNVSRMQ